MVTYALKIGLSKCSKVLLDVDSENDIAFKLYKKVGFNIESQVDYYKYELYIINGVVYYNTAPFNI